MLDGVLTGVSASDELTMTAQLVGYAFFVLKTLIKYPVIVSGAIFLTVHSVIEKLYNSFLLSQAFSTIIKTGSVEIDEFYNLNIKYYKKLLIHLQGQKRSDFAGMSINDLLKFLELHNKIYKSCDCVFNVVNKLPETISTKNYKEWILAYKKSLLLYNLHISSYLKWLKSINDAELLLFISKKDPRLAYII